MRAVLFLLSLRRRRWVGYAFGAAGVLLSLAIRIALGDLAFKFPFVIFLPPVILSAFFGGTIPGVLTAVAAGLIAKITLIEPVGSLALAWPEGWIAMAFYAVTVTIDILLIQAMRLAFAHAERAEQSSRALNRTLEARVEERTALLKQQEAERVETEIQLRQVQKMEAVGQLTGGVANDFNNLLTIVKSSAELLGRPGISEERRARYLQAISETADRAAKLTQQLLAFARRQPLVPTLFDVEDRIANLLGMLRGIVGSGVDIALDANGRGDLVDVDLNQFETALINLVVNARDAMPAGGRVSLRVDRADAIPATRNHGAAPGDYVAIRIEDSGTGMDAETVKRIFEPFYTTKEPGKGTGLGLSQVYGFAKQSSGEIAVTSAPGAGTIFTLYLPRASTAAPIAPPAAEPDEFQAGDGGCILVVEDNTVVGEFATQLLQDLGYGTVWATNAKAALAEIEADVQRFSAVFTDVVMPGMSGVELAEELRRRHPMLPVVLTSGYSQALATEGSHGFELLQKPYSATKVVQALRKVSTRRQIEAVAVLPA